MNAMRWLCGSVGLWMIATLACEPRGATPPTTANPSEVAPEPGPLELDEARMFAAVEYLASDELGGRYTLSEDIHKAADYIGKHYEALGISPVGPAYAVEFPMTTGAKPKGDQSLVIHRGSRKTAVAKDAFVPRSIGTSGTATGPLVFAGYGARADALDDVADAARPGYDDLAGIDLQGAIAVVLLEVPDRPNLPQMFSRLQRESEAFAKTARPLIAAKDQAGMKRLHKKARRKIASLVEPFLRGKKLPKEFFSAPSDPLTELNLQEILGPVMKIAEQLPGPQFGYRESRLTTKIERLQEAGAVGAIVVRGPRSFVDPKARDRDALPGTKQSSSRSSSIAIPVVQLRWKQADRLLRVKGKKISQLQESIDNDLEPHSGALGGKRATITTSLERITEGAPNVLATIPGSDLPKEIIIIGAHFDHIGVADGPGHCGKIEDDGICNGADDNASGTAVVMELARAWAESGRKPRRTIVFAHFAGEELGLHGSRALAKEPPDAAPFNSGEVIAMVNLDMVGRLGPRGLAIGGIGSSAGWMPLLEKIGNNDLEVVYDAAVTRRSDHANFYRQGVPVLFFFTHVHGDYHRAGDHADKINREGMAKIAHIVAELMLALGDGHELPFSRPKSRGEGLVGSLPGTNPDTVLKRVKPSSHATSD